MGPLPAGSRFPVLGFAGPRYFSDAVIAREVLTPKDLEQRFGLPGGGGDILHGAISLDQTWINRPVMGYAAYVAEPPRASTTAARVQPGAGVTGLPNATLRARL